MRQLTIIFCCLLFVACQEPAAPPQETQVEVAPVDANPAAPDFNSEGSDPQAIAIADSVVKYHGGRRAYDQVDYLTWNFFGIRTLYWDKAGERVRIEVPSEEAIYLLDYSSEEPVGAVQRGGEEITQPDSLKKYLQRALSIFINDSYWLVHPFKLKDSGVTLAYGAVEEDPQKSRPSHVIDMTFSEVGDTPENRYRLYVDSVNYRINTWQFFRTTEDEEPAIETPFDDYEEYDGIMLSADRSGRFQLKDIAAPEELDDELFTEF